MIHVFLNNRVDEFGEDNYAQIDKEKIPVFKGKAHFVDFTILFHTDGSHAVLKENEEEQHK